MGSSSTNNRKIFFAVRGAALPIISNICAAFAHTLWTAGHNQKRCNRQSGCELQKSHNDDSTFPHLQRRSFRHLRLCTNLNRNSRHLQYTVHLYGARKILSQLTPSSRWKNSDHFATIPSGYVPCCVRSFKYVSSVVKPGLDSNTFSISWLNIFSSSDQSTNTVQIVTKLHTFWIGVQAPVFLSYSLILR